MLANYFVLLFAALLIMFIAAKPYIKNYQRDKIKQQPFPKVWRKILKQQVPYYNFLPADLQLQLKQHILVFIEEKEFIGCNGLQITDEIKVCIAAQACLLLLNRKTDYFSNLRTILVYPSAFIKHQQITTNDGTTFTQQQILSGESWSQGKVILSWQDSQAGAKHPCDGKNVIIHEFAHQLDQENGLANGAPRLTNGQSYQQWSSEFNKQYQVLKKQVNYGETGLLDAYGATNPAEFFAVVSEVFFEQPKLLQAQYPILYQQLSLFYQVNPNSWR